MQRLLERILGLDKGFLSRPGDFSLEFNPQWPLQEYLGAVTWNIVLAAVALAVILYVYRREGRSRPARIILGATRALLVAFVVLLLNRPVLTLGQTREEPSVVAVLIDDSISMMKMRDVDEANPDNSPTRLEAAVSLLTAKDQALLRQLAAVHQLRLYRFSTDARPVGAVLTGGKKNEQGEAPKPDQITIDPKLVQAIQALDDGQDQPPPDRNRTQVVHSLLTVLADLQGQRLAGVVVVTDGRDTPVPPAAESMKRLKDYGVPVYPVAVGSEKSPTNLEVQAISVQDSVFVDDIANLKLTLRGTGYPKGHAVRLVLKDKATGQPLTDADGNPAQKTVTIDDDNPAEHELHFKPGKVGPITVVAEVERQQGELEVTDNAREAPVSVLDAKIAVLYVDGYPRWEYRYLKNEMIRDKTVDISCLLTSADPTFAQEGDPPDSSRNFPGPIRRFPESIEELMHYDVVLFGDVDPRQFTDRQLQLIAEFVAKRAGGFGMVAGPRWAPWDYKNTAIEAVLPVDLGEVEKYRAPVNTLLTDGFRPALTKVGAESSIFRFFPDRQQNEKYIREELQPIFWFAGGVTAKPGVGEVYAEHPQQHDPTGKGQAPLLVLGRYGAGRTLFSAIDDSWRWRFYTGEQTFDTYWVQQLRYLARGRKLGERRLNFALNRKTYDLGDQVRITLEVIDPVLLQQLPAELTVEVQDRETGQTVRYERLQKGDGVGDEYAGTFTADRIGAFVVKPPPAVGGDAAGALDLPMDVSVPKLEMARPEANLPILRQIAAPDPKTQQPVLLTLAAAPEALPRLLPSAAKTLWIPTSEPLWDAPLALLIIVLLLTAEWVIRKAYGML